MMVMKKIILNSALLLTLIFITGCKKEKPPLGEYIGEFNYDNPSSWDPQTVSYKVTESKEGYFLISRVDYLGNVLYGDMVYKMTNKKIEGRVPSNYPNSPYQVTGEWKKNVLKNNYIIKGTFTQELYQTGGPYTLYGTFEIKSN